MTTKRVALLAAVLVALIPAVASAQVTPERAQAIQDQLKDWLQKTVGPAVKIERSPVTVTAAGDHFDLAYPLAGVNGKAPITAKLTEIEGGRWAVADVKLPSPFKFQFSLPPAEPGAPAREATMNASAGTQDQQALIDPTLATPSTSSSKMGDVTFDMILPTGKQITHLDTGEGHSTLTPAGNGRVDATTDGTLTGYSVKMSEPGRSDPVTALAAQTTRLAMNVTGLSLERLRDFVQLSAQAAQTRQQDKAAGRPPPRMDQTTQLALLAILSDLMTGMTVDQQMTGVTILSHGMAGAAERVGFGFDGKSVEGKLRARMPILIAGLALPNLGLGDLGRLVPTQVSITPHLSAVPTAAFFDLARDAIATGRAEPADVTALFRDGPIGLGIDDLRLDLAGASFAGHVGLLLASPASMTGSGQIIADNFDSLQQAVAANQQTAQFAPAFLLAKGLARTESGHLVWDINYREGHLLVNGQDMQSLMGAGPRPKPARP